MYNYFMIIGYVCKEVEVRETKDGKKVCNLLLSVKRDFRNQDGEYEYDLLVVTLWEYITDLALECVTKGMKLAVKGRIVPKTETLPTGFNMTSYELRAEKLIFIDSKPQEAKPQE